MRRSLITVAFLSNGMVFVAAKCVSVYGYSQSKSVYLLCYFATALVLTGLALALTRRFPTAKAVLLGMLMGAFWLGSSASLVTALSLLPAPQCLPAFSCGHVLGACLLSYLFWKERITTRYGWAGIALAVVAIVLVTG